ncbi:MAG: alpha/beta hydrolase family protein [Microthrixaceae bacterium]
MDVTLPAGPPIEPPPAPVGYRELGVVAEDGRDVAVSCWYPARTAEGPAVRYPVVPGVGLTAAAVADAAPAAGRFPTVVFSHGRTGTRRSYVMLLEALAARGTVVLAPDHVGDRLEDWLGGTQVDDHTNGRRRVADVAAVLDAVPLVEGTGGGVVVAGHSYGGWTALATAAREPASVAGVVGLQPLVRGLSAERLGRVRVPVLLVGAAADTTTPPALDSLVGFEGLVHAPTRHVEVTGNGHQACSDVGLYADLAGAHADVLPPGLGDLLEGMAAQVTGRSGDDWRPVVADQLGLLAAFVAGVAAGGVPPRPAEGADRTILERPG